MPMLWVYGHYKYFNSFNAGSSSYVRICVDVIFWRITYSDGPHAKRGNILVRINKSELNIQILRFQFLFEIQLFFSTFKANL